MPLAGFIPTSAYQGFMSIPNQSLNGQLMTGFPAGDYMAQQGQWNASIGQQWDGVMGQVMPQMAGVRPYQGMMDQGQFAVLQRQHPVVQQQQPLRQQATPPPRAVQSSLREDQAHVRAHAVSPNKQLREQIDILNADRDSMRSEIEDLKRQLVFANSQIRRLNEVGSSSPMPIPSTTAPKPATPPARRANTPVSGTEDNLRGIRGSGSNLHHSPSASYHGHFPSASRSNNSLATSRSGTISGGARPAWKTMNAHSSPLSFGANVRQISGPNGCITLGITKLALGGPAEIAGLRLGDILEECEFKMADEKGNMIVRRLSGCGFSKNALQKSLNNLGIGNQVTFFVNRDGARFETVVSLCPVDRCDWGAEGFEALDRSFTPTEEMLNESFVPVVPEFGDAEIVDEKPRSQRWEQGWKLDFDKFFSFAVNEAKLHMGDEFASDEDAMSRFGEACQACEQQLIKEGHGDVRVPALWLNKDLILHFTGQQCEDNGLLC